MGTGGNFESGLFYVLVTTSPYYGYPEDANTLRNARFIGGAINEFVSALD